MIINVAELRELFKIASLDDDSLMLNLILAAEDEAKRRCGTVFEAQQITEYHSGHGDCGILLKNFPVNAITSIHDDPDRAYEADSLVDPADYTFESDGRVELDGLVFMQGLRNIKVVYNAGYTRVPYDLRVAVANIAFANYIEQNGSINMVEGQEFIYRPGKLRQAAGAILDRFAKIV